ncbi:hypothetical protein [Primorskyibacter sp. S187A]|uniref:hypothetical protein n=1 Tax=Primorskyibacter sp. S187A TaxID=3415130 RepID=UPI003C7E015A
MLKAKIAGRNAGALKYDVLTAMGAFALSQPKGKQRLILRLMTLITARYNWARDELSVGQREIARLWSVDERTVKREMAKLRAMGWLELRRAGVRGRVAQYGLGLTAILDDTRPRWADVGPDFLYRLDDAPLPDNVVPLSPRGQVAPPPIDGNTEWSLAKSLLHGEDTSLYAAWFGALERERRDGSRLTLRAPSRFCATYVMTHLQNQLLRAVQSVDTEITEVSVIA